MAATVMMGEWSSSAGYLKVVTDYLYSTGRGGGEESGKQLEEGGAEKGQVKF